MLSLKFVRENMATVMDAIRRRNLTLDLSQFIDGDSRRRQLLAQVEGLRQERNAVSEEVAARKKKGVAADDIIAGMRSVSQDIKELEEAVKLQEAALEEMLLYIPNIPHPSVPMGAGAEENPTIRTWGERRRFDFAAAPHWEIGEKLGLLDFETAAKITGTRFCLYRGLGARLERALINFMLDLHVSEHGYEEILPPFMVNRASMTGTGQLPKFESDLFHLAEDDFFLIPTAEVPLTNIHRGEILAGERLPLKYAAITPCFRREAGSYGKDTRGLIRQHQFNKVELVKFCRPEDSYAELESLLVDAETVLVRLGLPYRVVTLCTGDLGFSAAKTYDIEVWLPGQDAYREISSCSNFEDFQARRAQIRYRPDQKSKLDYVHTLNGSGLAVGRTVVAILENYQQGDGSVVVPDVLVPYMGGISRITSP